jgi:hypothetical protein
MKKILRFSDMLKESLPHKKSVDQLEKIRKLSKGTDIGDKVSPKEKEMANLYYFDNPIDTGIEYYKDYTDK